MGKYCSKCGNELRDNAKFCAKCGTRVGSLSEQNEIGEQVKRINGENIQESLLVTEKDNHKKWWQRTGGIIFWLIVFFPIGFYLMWRYADWKRNRKVIATLIWIIAFLCWPFGSYSDMSDKNEGIVIENDRAKYGAVYDYDLEEVKEKVGKVLSDYYNSDMNLDEFNVTPYKYENGTESYTYTTTVPQGYQIGIEFGIVDNKLTSVIVKTEYTLTNMSSEVLGDIQEIYSIIVSSITNDELGIDEIKDVVKTRNTKLDYYRNGNIYGICRTPDDSPTVFYYIVSACTDEKAEEIGCQRL